MSSVDYSTVGFKDIIVTLDGPVAVVLLNRAKQYAEPHHCQADLKSNHPMQEKHIRRKPSGRHC